ncbi:dTDP-glucose 4,6-dehydratase [Streptomyces sp. NPDC049879]|uniref:dTDP-glucose 4,6-dehydratase n=1 Tax=Streptomyces sp. NPDC049879 TaxID=3365598 RepID=UPI0037AF9226
MTTRILVTGGAGFIGSAYVRALLGPSGPGGPGGVAVTVLDALTYAGHRANLAPVRDHPAFRFVHGDIRDAALAARLMTEHDEVVHFAAESHVDRSIRDGGLFASTNVLGTQVLLDAARLGGVRVFVHISTDEVYGSLADGSWPETHPVDPTSPYAASKAAADLLALAQHRTHGLDVRITRCSNNFGPYQFPEKLIPSFVIRLLEGGTVPLYGDGLHVRDWLHVDDHVRAVELVRTRGAAGEVYNVGGGTELTNLALTRLILEACGAGPDRIRHVADRKGHDRRYSVDWTKIRTRLGYAPRADFPAALAATVAWYRDHPDWWRPLRDRAAR